MKKLILAFSCLIAACASAPRKPLTPTAISSPRVSPFVQACKEPGVECTEQVITVNLFHRDDSPFSLTMPPPTVIVQHDYVTVLSGQTVYVEADVDGDKLVNLHFVQSPTHPEKTLTLKLQQLEMGQKTSAGSHMMMFTIENPFDRWLKYSAGMMPLDQPSGKDGVYVTDTCPVLSKGSASESWPEPIFQLVLGDFHFIDPNAPGGMTCTN